MSHRRQARHAARRGHPCDWQAARNIQLPRPRDIICPGSTEQPGREAQFLAGHSEVRNRLTCQVDSSRRDRVHANWTTGAMKRPALILLRRLMQWRSGFGQRGGQLNLPAFAPPKIRFHTCRSCRSSDPPTFKPGMLFRDASLSIRQKSFKKPPSANSSARCATSAEQLAQPSGIACEPRWFRTFRKQSQWTAASLKTRISPIQGGIPTASPVTIERPQAIAGS